jgi:hypothetical protein
MGVPHGAPDALLFVAVMHGPQADPAEAVGQLEGAFGSVASRSDPYRFDRSDYYRGEMGEGLRKFIAVFDRPVPQDDLAAIKLATNGMEQRVGAAGGRRFNLDPGLMSLSTVILASTKAHAHRIYLGRGIWAEAALLYEKGSWQPLPWTYPDYRRPEVLEFMGRVRRGCRGKIHATAEAGR